MLGLCACSLEGRAPVRNQRLKPGAGPSRCFQGACMECFVWIFFVKNGAMPLKFFPRSSFVYSIGNKSLSLAPVSKLFNWELLDIAASVSKNSERGAMKVD